jgi:hypothetical protein
VAVLVGASYRFPARVPGRYLQEIVAARSSPLAAAQGCARAESGKELGEEGHHSLPGSYLQYQTPITAADLTLTIAGQAPIHPQTFPGGPDPAASNNGSSDGSNSILTQQFAFIVPAGLTAATLTLTSPPETAIAAYTGGGSQTVHPGPAAFPIAAR